MFKATPNPPHTDPLSPHETLDPEKLDEAARRALDYYLKPNHGQPDKKTDKQLDYSSSPPTPTPKACLPTATKPSAR
ncbi:hypothetical protein [Pseudomonas sp. St290]|uniref:hypothetical protein n=1 Tax=Pseudomonas sp. St290 TaxID=1602166 RepID=UPI001BED7FFC|nr:hypothetical protein [Pseudomonas sp. St290]BBH35107.1 hypothetical protein PBDP_4644 [Pseudomonas sp. St290]